MKLGTLLADRKGKKIYRDGNTVIKVYDEGYAKSEILFEALNQSRIEETGLHIPKILEVGSVGGKWAIVLEYIKGRNLADMMRENPNDERVLELFVSLHQTIHTKKAPLLTTLKDKMTRKISYAELDATIRYDLQLKLREMGGTSNVCHCDYTPDNILITDDGVPYVIDWSHATQGNTCVDAVITYILFLMKGADEMAERYLSLYCEMSGIGRNSILKWLPVAAASKSMKMEGEDKAALLKLAKSTEYENLEE